MKTAAILLAGLLLGVTVAFWDQLVVPVDPLRDVPTHEIEAAADRHCRIEGEFPADLCACMVDSVVDVTPEEQARDILLTAAFMDPKPAIDDQAELVPDAGSEPLDAATPPVEEDSSGPAEPNLVSLWQTCLAAVRQSDGPPLYEPPEAGLRLTLDSGRVLTIDSSNSDMIQYFFHNAQWRRNASYYYRSLVLLNSSQGLSNQIEDMAALDRLWPLAAGNSAEYKVISSRFGRLFAQRSERADVLRTEMVSTDDGEYQTYVIHGQWRVTQWLDSTRQFYDAGDWTAWYAPDTQTWLRWEDNVYLRGETVGRSRMQVVNVSPI